MFDFARESVVTGGKLYEFTQVGQGSAQNVWQFDINSTTSNPPEVMTMGSVGCVMNGVVYFVGSGANYTIKSCTWPCTGTPQTISSLATTEGVGLFPSCDPANNEIIWAVTNQYGVYTIRRASATGTNVRSITSFVFPNDGNFWQISNGAELPTPDKLFYSTYSDATGKTSLYYISTSTVNDGEPLISIR